MQRKNRPRTYLIINLCFLSVTLPAWADELPKAVQIDRHKQLMFHSIKNGNCEKIMQQVSILEEMEASLPSSIFWVKGKCYYKLGKYSQSLVMLKKYFQVIDSNHKNYQKALAIYNMSDIKSKKIAAKELALKLAANELAIEKQREATYYKTFDNLQNFLKETGSFSTEYKSMGNRLNIIGNSLCNVSIKALKKYDTYTNEAKVKFTFGDGTLMAFPNIRSTNAYFNVEGFTLKFRNEIVYETTHFETYTERTTEDELFMELKTGNSNRAKELFKKLDRLCAKINK